MKLLYLLATLLLAHTAAAAEIAPLLTGDERIVVTQHVIRTPDGPLHYEARAGRLPIRTDQTGEVRGYVFFTAYVAKNRGAGRPLTIAWNGGPTVPSIYLHTELLGPRRITDKGFVDNSETLLRQSDLVFYDPVQTGFSRVAKPDFAPEFFNMQGDVAVAAEFVRAYRARFDAETQKLFLLGESYGAFRAGAVAEFLAKRGVAVAGLVFVSGGFPSVKMPMSFWHAMNVQNRVATALHYKRLAEERQRDPAATMRQADAWVTGTYLPALAKADTLPEAERSRIAGELAAWTGVRAEQIDRRTLVMNTQQFLTGYFDGDKDKELSDVDTRRFGGEKQAPGWHLALSRYLRRELGYATDLGYAGKLGYGSDLGYRALEAGYVPTPGPERRSSGQQWTYNQTPGAPAALEALRADGESGHLFNENPPWTQAAMAALPKLRVYVALGRFDPTNSCEGQVRSIATLPKELTDRITVKCYQGGHMMFRDEPARIELSADLARFVSRR
jgi:carboxypeptidase C (cathepsin A)